MAPVIAEQLRHMGIDAVAVRELNLLGDSDSNHLEHATAMSRVLCTHDTDFLRLHAQGLEHTGIVFSPHYKASVGYLVKGLRDLHHTYRAEDMHNQVVYL